jgi:hypothetical protein
MPNLRDRSTAQKVYLPTSMRENQYLLVDIPLTDELIAYFQPNDKQNNLSAFYYQLSELFFNCCDKFSLNNAVFIANDKLPKVYFNSEKYQLETTQQLLFFYNPAKHSVRKWYFKGEHRAKKIKLLFLASGEDIRFNAANFHLRVREMLNDFAEQANITLRSIRLRDHQHITYDLFSKEKGCNTSQGHKLRSIENRYRQKDIALPENITEISYAVVTLPVTESLKKLVTFDFASNEPFKPLYEKIRQQLEIAATTHKVSSGAVIANGLEPIVRQDNTEEITTVGEIQKLSYNSENPQEGFSLKFTADTLVNRIYIVLVANREQFAHHGYGKFLQRVEHTLSALAETLAFNGQEDEIVIRFHQHLSFNLQAPTA